MLFTIIVFVITLGVLVLIHEFGHFITARKLGVKVEEFGFGFPPRIFSIQKGETLYSFNIIPLGGFVKLKGESMSEEQKREAGDEDSFSKKPAGVRSVILAAGIFMNLALCAVLLSIGFMVGLPSAIENLSAGAQVSDVKIHVVSVQEGSRAASAAIVPGDTITALDGQEFRKVADLLEYKKGKIGQTLAVSFMHKGEAKTVDVEVPTDGILGVGLVEAGLVSYPWYLALLQGVKTTFLLAAQIFVSLWNMIQLLIFQQRIPADVAGPVGIAALTGEVAQMGWIYIVQFVALLSLNLAIFNLLPWPALDGGRLLFVLIEKIRGKAVDQKIEIIIHNVGFVLLLVLVLLITFRDIGRFL